jgi:hypothetical protein
MICLAAHMDEPISGNCLLLPLVFNGRQGWGLQINIVTFMDSDIYKIEYGPASPSNKPA